MSVAASILYIAVRIYYISRGKASINIPLNVSVRNPLSGVTVTVGELLPKLQVGDEITRDMLNRPELVNVLKIVDGNRYSYWWSCCVLAAEIGGFVLVHVSQQMFYRQHTVFYELPEERVVQLREVWRSRSFFLVWF
jgi:hypothetical protein